MLPDFDRADRIGEFWGYPESRTFADQQSGTVVGGVGLAQMALLVNGASSQTVWIGSRSRRSRPESPHTRKDGNRNPRGRLPPPGVPPFFLRADAIVRRRIGVGLSLRDGHLPLAKFIRGRFSSRNHRPHCASCITASREACKFEPPCPRDGGAGPSSTSVDDPQTGAAHPP